MGDPAPGEDNHPEDYIIIDDTDSDPDSDDDYEDEAGADIMESSSDQNFYSTTIVSIVFGHWNDSRVFRVFFGVPGGYRNPLGKVMGQHGP